MSDIKLRGEDVEDALRDWVKGYIKGDVGIGYDLGKFFFSVSVATLGFIAAVEKLSKSPSLDLCMVTAIFLLVLSMLASISMVIPKIQKVNGTLDLKALHETKVNFVRKIILLWLGLWGFGLIFGVYAFLY